MAGKKKEEKLSKYEIACIIGARARQLAMGAPTVLKNPSAVLNALQLAMLEYEKKVIPLQVVRASAV